LGLSLARRFVKKGDLVFGVSRTQRYWTEARRQIPDENSFFLYDFDLACESDVKKFLRTIYRATGRIDSLSNSAGFGGPLKRLEQCSEKEYRTILDSNLLTAFLTCKHVIPIFKKQRRGVVINISSMAGTRAVPRLALYSASKFGVRALTQALAKENPDGDLYCLTVSPGGMNTRMREDLFGSADARKQQSPDFVADVICRILSGQIPVPHGSEVVVRHGKVTAVQPLPAA
jgi:3-oxoacyl-[acyl-carrier protein] reductase